ncbi:MAG TPA: hypothetical protein VLJ88_12960 [Propionibacteriaceae bacterium]|nr:hypothetical protein [Propionibacteriaceae bacterium]
MTDEPESLRARIDDALGSGDPERIAEGLGELRLQLPPRPPVSAPAPGVLDAFPDGPPPEVVRDYIWVVGNYRPFATPMAPEQTVRWWVEAAVRGGGGAAALQVVLYLRHQGRPPGADVGDAIGYLADRPIAPGREKQGAEDLVRYFLDHSETYERAIRALAALKDHPTMAGILRVVRPYVRPDDRPALGL